MVDTSAILKKAQDYAASINDRDVEAAVSYFTSDSVMVDSFGEIRRGQDEIEEAFKHFFDQLKPSVKLELGEVRVRVLMPEFAIWQSTFEFVPPVNDLTQRGYIVQILKKVDDRWMILESHSKLFPQV